MTEICVSIRSSEWDDTLYNYGIWQTPTFLTTFLSVFQWIVQCLIHKATKLPHPPWRWYQWGVIPCNLTANFRLSMWGSTSAMTRRWRNLKDSIPGHQKHLMPMMTQSQSQNLIVKKSSMPYSSFHCSSYQQKPCTFWLKQIWQICQQLSDPNLL